jgi:hypothetical protein
MGRFQRRVKVLKLMHKWEMRLLHRGFPKFSCGIGVFTRPGCNVSSTNIKNPASIPLTPVATTGVPPATHWLPHGGRGFETFIFSSKLEDFCPSPLRRGDGERFIEFKLVVGRARLVLSLPKYAHTTK